MMRRKGSINKQQIAKQTISKWNEINREAREGNGIIRYETTRSKTQKGKEKRYTMIIKEVVHQSDQENETN